MLIGAELDKRSSYGALDVWRQRTMRKIAVARRAFFESSTRFRAAFQVSPEGRLAQHLKGGFEERRVEETRCWGEEGWGSEGLGKEALRRGGLRKPGVEEGRGWGRYVLRRRGLRKPSVEEGKRKGWVEEERSWERRVEETRCWGREGLRKIAVEERRVEETENA
jgi:hypothetical protein